MRMFFGRLRSSRPVFNRSIRCFSTSGTGVGEPAAHEALCDQHEDASVFLTFGSSCFRQLTFGELEAKSRKIATVLREKGVKKGDRIGVMLKNGPEVYITALAAARVGACYLPLFPAFQHEATATRMMSSGAVAFITSVDHRHKFADVDNKMVAITCGSGGKQKGDVDFEDVQQHGQELQNADHVPLTNEDDLLAMLYTSGTTGAPKGVPIPRKSLKSFAVYLTQGLGVQEHSKFWNVADPGWAYGLYYNVYGPLYLGHEAHVSDQPFNVKIAIEILKNRRITCLAAAPTVYRALRASPECEKIEKRDFNLEAASSAGEPLPAPVVSWFESKFGTRIKNHYGQSENGMMCLDHHFGPKVRPALNPYDEESLGIPMEGFSMAVMNDNNQLCKENEVGELVVNVKESPLFWFPGYWKRDTPVADSNGFYHTGDKARMKLVDGEPNFFFKARMDDIIISAGYRIGPSEVESGVMELDFVAECAAVEVPDELKGGAIKVFVVRKNINSIDAPNDDHDAKRIHDHIKNNVSKHFVPKYVEFRSELPKTDSGKIKRFLLRQN